MAKKWTPTQRQLSMYDELLRRQNETRKRLLRRRRIAEEEGVGRTLPDLIIPKKANRYRDINKYRNRFKSREEFIKESFSLRRQFSGYEISWAREHYLRSYKDKLLDFIADAMDKVGYDRGYLYDKYTGERLLKGKGWRGRFSNEQLEEFKTDYRLNDIYPYIELYNSVAGMETSTFMAMYENGFIPQLRYIYDEMNDIGEFNILGKYKQDFEDFRKLKSTGNITIKSLINFTEGRKSATKDIGKQYQSDLTKKFSK